MLLCTWWCCWALQKWGQLFSNCRRSGSMLRCGSLTNRRWAIRSALRLKNEAENRARSTDLISCMFYDLLYAVCSIFITVVNITKDFRFMWDVIPVKIWTTYYMVYKLCVISTSIISYLQLDRYSNIELNVAKYIITKYQITKYTVVRNECNHVNIVVFVVQKCKIRVQRTSESGVRYA